ncbi:MAG: hypothetical protein ABIE68_04955 [bacterium]
MEILYFLLNWGLKIIGILFLVLFFFTIFSEVVNFKKSKEVKSNSLIMSIIMAVGMLFIFDWLYGLNFAPGSKWIYYGLWPLVGAGIGIGLSMTTKVTKVGGKVLSTGNIWYLAIWSISVLIIQFMSLLEIYSGISSIKVTVIVTTAILISGNIMLLMRSNKVKEV